MALNIIALGPPGAGKGTQAQRLSEAFGLLHLSSGDLLRGERAAGTELGDKVGKFMDAGDLVPDEIIVEVVLARLEREAGGPGVLLDGFPRTVPQADALDKALTAAGAKIDVVLDLLVPDENIVERITGRRSCPKCNKVYHVKYIPPAKEGVCDDDGEALMQRKDDTAEVVKQRLDAYHTQTAPLESYYSDKGNLREVDGTRDIDAIFADLKKITEEYF